MLVGGRLWSILCASVTHSEGQVIGGRTCVQTPSTTSTRTSAPSHRRDAMETSDEKSTCPGVSIIFTMYVLLGWPVARKQARTSLADRLLTVAPLHMEL